MTYGVRYFIEFIMTFYDLRRGRAIENINAMATKKPEDDIWTYPSNPTETLVEFVNKLKDADHRENLKFVEPAVTK